MAKYIDGFVIPIKKTKLQQYKKMAALGKKVWMEHGALDYYECIGTKITDTWGLPFAKLCSLKKDENIVFAFIVYKSKAHRDAVTKKVHKDPRMQPEQFKGDMPFDMKRFSVGEFKTIVHT